MCQLRLFTRANHHIFELAQMIVDPSGSNENQLPNVQLI